MDRTLRCLLAGVVLSFMSCLTTVEPSYVTATADSFIVGQFQLDPVSQQLKPSPTPILSTTVVIPSTMRSGASVLLQADGTFAPASNFIPGSALAPQAIAKVYIEVESTGSGPVPSPISNESIIDWRHSAAPLAHSFNVIGGPTLLPGAYTVRLMAVAVPDENGNIYPFVVTKETSLAVMRPRAGPIEQSNFTGNTQPNDFFDTKTLPDCLLDPRFGPEPRPSPALVARLPDDQLVHIPVPGLIHQGAFELNKPWIVLASGNFTLPDSRLIGDGMWGLFVDGNHCGDQYSTWSVNDMQPNSETTGPMFVQGYFDKLPCRPISQLCFHCPPPPAPDPSLAPCLSLLTPGQPGPHTVTLDATKFPFHSKAESGAENDVVYSVAGATMLFMSGRTDVQGSARLGKDVNSAVDDISMLPLGAAKALASVKITLPDKHNGVVFFTSKTRNMGMARTGETGKFVLWIEIREGDVSNTCDPTVAPLLASPHAVQWTTNDSQRTLSASLLTAGPGRSRLTANTTYTVSACGEADVNPDDPTHHYANPVLTADVPLIWFDGDGANP